MKEIKKKYDVVIIGSGMAGLTSAVILSRHGYSVCVLEKNNQFGGNLQTFTRDKQLFDTGVHYLGGLGKGENLHQYFKYLGIMDDLNIKKMDEDAFDIVTFGDDPVEYCYAQGYDKFSKRLKEYFPDEKKAIDDYCTKMQELCDSFPLYNLKKESIYNLKMLGIKLIDFLNSITDNKKLISVLLGTNLLYAGTENTPLYVHALSVNSYITSSWRCVDGGSQISRLLIKQIKKNGGELFKYQEVIDFGVKNNEIETVITKSGIEVHADYFISNIEPKLTLKMLKGRVLKKSYFNRVEKIKSMISIFSIYVVLKPETFEYFNNNIYHFNRSDKVWFTEGYDKKSWPESYMISLGRKKNQGKWAHTLTVMTYMDFNEFSKWKDTVNTVALESKRGEDYEKFKEKKVQQVIDEIEKKFPNFRDCIRSVHSSTPLSNRDYIGSDNGAIYGYEKDADNPLASLLSPKTKSKKLFFTGQSLNMHGILGVAISGVLTCSHILGKEKIMRSIQAAL